MDETDEQLLKRLQQGDHAAFEALFLRHYQRIYRLLYGLVRCREEAEDLAQEALLTLYHQPPRSIAGESLAAWLGRVALNRGYNALRGERRSRQRADQIGRLEGAEAQVVGDPYSEVARAEERAHVRAAIARLPERQGMLLLLRYAGLSYAEIAAVLEMNPASVGKLLARAERAFLAVYQRAVEGAHDAPPPRQGEQYDIVL